MTTSAPIPAAEEAFPMANPSDTAPKAPPAQVPPQAQAAAASTLRAQVAENPLLSFFGLLVIALLAAAIASPSIRINDTNHRIDRLDARMTAGFDAVYTRFDDLKDDIDARFDDIDARFEQVDARFEQVDARFDELDLKLTALIAKLNATDDVNAAIDGHLRSPAGPSPAEADADR